MEMGKDTLSRQATLPELLSLLKRGFYKRKEFAFFGIEHLHFRVHLFSEGAWSS